MEGGAERYGEELGVLGGGPGGAGGVERDEGTKMWGEVGGSHQVGFGGHFGVILGGDFGVNAVDLGAVLGSGFFGGGG